MDSKSLKTQLLSSAAFLEMIQGRKLVGSSLVNDYTLLKRSWAERLFTLPWRPRKTHRLVYRPKAYMTGRGDVIVSYETLMLIDSDSTHSDS